MATSSQNPSAINPITIILHYGGQFKLVPRESYEGGFIEKFEGVEYEEFNLAYLHKLADICGVIKCRRFYTMVNKSFTMLFEDKTLAQYMRKHIKSTGKEVLIYVDKLVEYLTEEQENENVVSNDNNVSRSDVFADDYVEKSIIHGSDNELDSGCDSDDEGYNIGSNRNKGEKYQPPDTYNPHFAEKMRFPTKVELRKAIHAHAIETMRDLYIKKNDSDRMYAECRADGCTWKLNARRIPEEPTFYIKTYQPTHQCCKTFKVGNLKSSYLAEKYVDNFKTDPDRSVEGWRLDVVEQLGVTVSWDQAYRTKKKALELINGDPNEQYSMMWNYRSELLRSNPGSTIVLDTESDGDGKVRFRAFYCCFAATKQGFLGGCRSIIGIDGAHLSGPHKGVLFTAVGIDPNNMPYPIAWAVMSSETKDNWIWFLTFLKTDLIIVKNEDYTWISDRQKGLIEAVKHVFEGSEHRFCVRHMWKNMVKAGFSGDSYKDAVFKASNATNIEAFNIAMQEIKDLDHEAYKWLEMRTPTQWSKAHFSTYPKSDMVLNNFCESTNRALKKAREKPILVMLEWLREWMMRRLQTNRDRANEKWSDLRICPEADKILQNNMEFVGACRVKKSNDLHYQVSTTLHQYNVSFDDSTCTCRKWQLTGIPCTHTLACLSFMKKSPYDYVHPYYSVETYKNVYAPAIFGINGKGLWGETYFIEPLPPDFGRVAGRPSTERRRSNDEPKSKTKNASKRGPKKQVEKKRLQKSVTCSYCKMKGHNNKGCQKKKSDEIEKANDEEMIRSREFVENFGHLVDQDLHNSQFMDETFSCDIDQDNLRFVTDITVDQVSCIQSTSGSILFGDPSKGNNGKLPVRKKKVTNNGFRLMEPTMLPPIMPQMSSLEVDEHVSSIAENIQPPPTYVHGPLPWSQIGHAHMSEAPPKMKESLAGRKRKAAWKTK